MGLKTQYERMRLDKRLTSNNKSDTIKIADIAIHKGVGAKPLNYDIEDADGSIYHYLEGTRVQNCEVFAGYGTKTPLHEGVAEGLTKEFKSDTENWQHTKGFGTIDVLGEGVRAEVHWFYEKSVGQVKHKIKRWLE